jgi:hypothetical protein
MGRRAGSRRRVGLALLPAVAPLGRHRLAVVIVLVMAACLAYLLKNTPTQYSDSSTVVFSAAFADVNPSPALSQSLIASEAMMTETMMSPGMAEQVRAAGGTAPFSMIPFNVYNMQYPDYAEPTATLTATSLSEADAQRTFRIVLRVLTQRMAVIQADARVPAENRIQVNTVGSTGTLVQPGSPARAFGGLVLLTLIAAISAANFLDRRRARLDSLGPGPARSGRGTCGTRPRSRPQRSAATSGPPAR